MSFVLGTKNNHPCPTRWCRWSHFAEVHGCSPSFCIAFWRSWVFLKTNVGKAWLRFCCSLAKEWWGLLAPETVKNCWERLLVVVRNQKVSRWVNLLSKLGDEYEIMDLKISISQLWTNRRFISVQRVIPKESYELAVLWPRNMMQQ